MVTIEQIKDLKDRLDTLLACLDIEGKRAKVKQLEQKTQAPDFWNDAKAAEAFMKSISGVKSWVTAYDAAAAGVEDLEVLFELAEEKELDEAFAAAEKQVEDLEIKNMAIPTHIKIPRRTTEKSPLITSTVSVMSAAEENISTEPIISELV